jgi:hypothetical protein
MASEYVRAVIARNPPSLCALRRALAGAALIEPNRYAEVSQPRHVAADFRWERGSSTVHVVTKYDEFYYFVAGGEYYRTRHWLKGGVCYENERTAKDTLADLLT